MGQRDDTAYGFRGDAINAETTGPTKFSFAGLRARTAPEPAPLPAARSEEPRFPFTMSYPDPRSLPIMEAHAALGEALAEVGGTPTVYPDPQGYPPLREYIAGFLGRRRGMAVSPDDVLLTEGSGQAIHFVAEALIDPGDVVIVDHFVYGGTLWSLRRFQSDVRGVVSDADGMVPDALDETIEGAIAEGRRPKLLYLIPTFQNPQAWTMPIKRRREIVEVGGWVGKGCRREGPSSDPSPPIRSRAAASPSREAWGPVAGARGLL